MSCSQYYANKTVESKASSFNIWTHRPSRYCAKIRKCFVPLGQICEDIQNSLIPHTHTNPHCQFQYVNSLCIQRSPEQFQPILQRQSIIPKDFSLGFNDQTICNNNVCSTRMQHSCQYNGPNWWKRLVRLKPDCCRYSKEHYYPPKGNTLWTDQHFTAAHTIKNNSLAVLPLLCLEEAGFYLGCLLCSALPWVDIITDSLCINCFVLSKQLSPASQT